MLESEVRDVVAERVKKVVVAVVMRAEKFLRLIDEVLVVVPGFCGASSAAALSAAISISVRGSCASGTTFRNSPVMTGESTSVVSEAGEK